MEVETREKIRDTIDFSLKTKIALGEVNIRDTIDPVFFAYNAKRSLWQTFELGSGYFFFILLLSLLKSNGRSLRTHKTKIIRLL